MAGGVKVYSVGILENFSKCEGLESLHEAWMHGIHSRFEKLDIFLYHKHAISRQ